MSYSFNATGADKHAAKLAVLEKFDAIVLQQPVHKADRDAVLANAGAVIDLLAEDDTKDISVSVSGYVSWSGADHIQLSTVSIACSATRIARS